MKFIPRIGFRGKVLIPTIGMMLILLAGSAWLINRLFIGQLERDTVKQLATADAVFQNSQSLRARNLLARYRNISNEPRVKATLQVRATRQEGDAATIRHLLKHELLEPLGCDVLALFNEEGKVIATARSATQYDMAALCSYLDPVVQGALEGEATAALAPSAERLLDVAVVPVYVGDIPVGVVAAGNEIGDAVAREIRPLTDSEIVYLVNDLVVASTLNSPDLKSEFVRLFRQGIGNAGGAYHRVVLNGEHYMARVGRFPSVQPGDRLGYLILSSYEQALQALQATQRQLLVLSLAAMVLSALAVWLTVRRASRPLIELRDSAEAVGQGDFSRTVAVSSGDELGDLAEVFNHMTANLQLSHAELEKTVSTLRRTQEQLVQREKLSAIGEFVAGITHELNNPLTAVLGFAELLQQTPLDEDQKRDVQAILNGAQRCQKIVMGLLSFARQHKPERKRVCVNELVNAVMNIMSYDLRTSNIEVVLRLGPELPAVLVDPHQIQQVLLNLVNNARQALEAFRSDGRITLATERVGQRIHIQVEDNGPGISRDNLRKIFDPFFTTKPVGKGTGLGLSLSYGIVREHGGQIVVRSEEGAGACFTVELPVAAANAKGTEDGAAPAGVPAAQGRGRRVLVIDDEETILDLARGTLQAVGYEVDLLSDGRQTLRQVQSCRYDVIVCDLKMPGMSGQQIFEQLQSINPDAARKVLFMTGDIVNEKTQTFFQRVAQPCLAKPFTLAEFQAAVGRLLAAV